MLLDNIHSYNRVMPELEHDTLNATLVGVDLGPCTQYRGIQYGASWGPRCPQNKYDVGHLLRAPEGNIFYDESEDEFKCLNLDVTAPANAGSGDRLPVMLWIHGGSQIISFGNGASKIGDTLKLVQDSIQLGKPIIIVSVQYRLNMFHVGDGKGTKNLGFKDQQTALQWVRLHIDSFGGDRTNVTLAGESAGAVFVHGLVASGARVKRSILMSGSLYMSPPRPEADARAFPIEPVLKRVQEKGYPSLKEAPVNVLLQAQAEIPVPSVFMQQEDCLLDWQGKTGEVEELLIGECEFESVLWRNGVEAMTAAQIVECFDKAGASSKELKEPYHINEARPTQSKHGALDFMEDLIWVVPSLVISKLFGGAEKKAYRYLFDQANPWQASSRAHHAVDLLYLFGGFDISMNPAADALSKEMQRRCIFFVNGEAPWSAERLFAFGPLGDCKEIDNAALATRRRIRQSERLQEMTGSDLKAAFGSLAAGRIDLHN
ncbi:Alpha/Beta hydrolase protein [Delphinella strobiligena]|nr:Alpha/Beta hydrolase protein [Delphinella strobiligena]